MGVWAVMVRRRKHKYMVVGDTAAGLWLLLIEFNFAYEEFIHFSDGIWARMILCSWWKRSALVWCLWLLLCRRWAHDAHIDGCVFGSILVKGVDDFADLVYVGIFQVEFRQCDTHYCKE